MSPFKWSCFVIMTSMAKTPFTLDYFVIFYWFNNLWHPCDLQWLCWDFRRHNISCGQDVYFKIPMSVDRGVIINIRCWHGLINISFWHYVHICTSTFCIHRMFTWRKSRFVERTVNMQHFCQKDVHFEHINVLCWDDSPPMLKTASHVRWHRICHQRRLLVRMLLSTFHVDEVSTFHVDELSTFLHEVSVFQHFLLTSKTGLAWLCLIFLLM